MKKPRFLSKLLKSNEAETEKKDITLLPIADTHTGSTTALHPYVRKDKTGKYVSLLELGGWFYSNRPNYMPDALQVRMWEFFEKCLSSVAEFRKNTSLFILVDGDAIDGDHHGTHQLITQEVSEQDETHVELMEYVKYRLGFDRGDQIAYVLGTNVHVGVEEEKIAKFLDAYQYPGGNYCASFLTLELNGVLIWAYHKGVSAGQGHNRGNACILKMKQIYYQCLQDGNSVPELIITGHTHDYYHATWTAPNGINMQYVILPSWQDKTRFVTDNMATNKNKVGMVTITITKEGRAIVNKPMLLNSPHGERIVI